MVATIYLALLAIVARHPNLPKGDRKAELADLPQSRNVLATGLYSLLPTFFVFWIILVDRLSPSFSAYWTIIALIMFVVTQRALESLMRLRTV